MNVMNLIKGDKNPTWEVCARSLMQDRVEAAENTVPDWIYALRAAQGAGEVIQHNHTPMDGEWGFIDVLTPGMDIIALMKLWGESSFRIKPREYTKVFRFDNNQFAGMHFTEVSSFQVFMASDSQQYLEVTFDNSGTIKKAKVVEL